MLSGLVALGQHAGAAEDLIPPHADAGEDQTVDQDEPVYLSGRNSTDREEAYRQRGIGTWYDVMIPSSWPIPLEEIRSKVFLWQGENDQSVSPAMGRFVARHIPDCEAVFLENEGHFWLIEHCTEMLEKLVGYAVRTA